MTNIAVFVGSLQQGSLNKKLARNLESLLPEGTNFIYVDINLPLFNQDLEVNYPAEAQLIKDIVAKTDGVLFVTPEYNRSIPGVLKNAIDWASRPWGANSFADKPVGIVGASPGSVGTAVAQSDLRHVIAFLDGKLMGQPELYLANAHEHFDENGVIVDATKDMLQTYISAFCVWVEDEK